MKYQNDFSCFTGGQTLLSELNLDGENILIKILEKKDKYKIINCEEFIGIKCLGKWEDTLIDSITVEQTGDVIVESVFKIKHNYEVPQTSFNSKNIFHPWVQLNIKLIDGCYVKIACKSTYIVEA